MKAISTNDIDRSKKAAGIWQPAVGIILGIYIPTMHSYWYHARADPRLFK
jgi:hypothetical protein